MAQTTSKLWKSLWRMSNTEREYKFEINGVEYGPDQEVEHSYSNGLFEDFGIGNAYTASLKISLFADNIPKAATIKRYVRLKNRTQVSEWIPKGTFFTNRRSEDDGYWTLEAYDAMRKAEVVWEPDQSLEFPMTMPDAVAEFCRILGVTLDSRTETPSPLEVTESLSEQFFVGLDITGFENTGKYKPISRVTLIVDDESVLTAGDDTGLEITASCPHATQDMVNTLLSQLQGYEYQSFTADAANLDPSAELGDGVTVSGLYSFISSLEDDGDGYPSISAPGEVELEDEYPAAGPMTQEFNRKIAETRSTITKTAEEIRLEVENEIEGLSSNISVQLDSITSTVQGLNGQVSTISQKVNNITLTVQNGTDRSYIDLSVGGVTVASQVIRFTGDVVFESSLTDGSTMISGDNILTGEVSAEYIRLGGEMAVYESLSSRADLGGYIGYVTSYDYNGSRTYGMGMIEAVSENQVVATSGGVRMTTDNGEVVVATNITLDTRNAVNVYANRFTSDVELNVTSDRNAKDDIRYDVAEKYISLFDRLNPVSFLYKGKEAKRHLGFIAQDVEDVLNEIGMPLDDFAALSVDDEGRYGLSYGEFVAVLTAKIHQLEQRLKALEG